MIEKERNGVMKYEWVEINESSGSIFTEVMQLENTCLIRVYSWCPLEDKCITMSMTEIDPASGRVVINNLKKRE